MDKKSKEILERFTQRLIDNNSRSRSYFLGVLKSTDTIDLYEYAKVFNGHFNLSLAINKHNKMDFPYQPIIPERISNTLIESKDFYINKKNTFFKEIIKHIPLINEKDSNTIYNNIENPDLENLVKDICLKYEDTFINKYRSLDTLLETSKAIERESARNDLYIGYPFIEGKFFNGKVFRGPLILHSVNIESYPHLKSIKFNDTIYLNPVFIISYLVENKMTHQRFDFELTASKDIIKSTIKFLKDRLALKIDVLDITALVPFKSCTKPFYEEKYALYPGEFKITNNAVIGIFPISSKSIYYDIKNIIVYRL